MHHMYSSKKGDPLCPLGFHPQVRWPTRCKRCFRDYKEHGGKKDSLKDITSSSPSLSYEQSSGRSAENGRRGWSSATNLAKDDFRASSESSYAAAGWTSLMDLSAIDNEERLEDRRPTKLQIKEVIDNSNESASENDVEFIIQVKKSKTGSSKSSEKNGERRMASEEWTEKSEVEQLRLQVRELQARCERAEKEKSEILMRRLATMETISSKAAPNEVQKLQKKNEALTQEKNSLLTKIRDLEKEVNSKTFRGERDREKDELRSKLKAAENLCESLMDDNEDMKKEIRQLEEEIYELQDTFRDEQADEHVRLRKSLEQSNKNCRILSFKLRKVERKVEELETEKATLEKKYEEVKKVEETLQKVKGEFQSRPLKKATEFTTKVQLKKMVEEMEKEIGDMMTVFTNISDGKEVDIQDMKIKDNHGKYDKLSKEHELLKEKLDSVMKELLDEKEKKKFSTKVEEKNMDLQNTKKKLEEAVTLRENERKTWDQEKTALLEEKEKLKSKLLSLSAEKLKVYNETVQLKKDLETAKTSENEGAKLEKTINDLKKELLLEKDKSKKLQDDLSGYTERESKMKQSMTSVEQTKTKLDTELKRLKKELENTKTSNSTKINDLTREVSELKKEKEKLLSQVDQEKESKESEVATLKKKISALEKTGLNTKRMNELRQTYNEKILMAYILDLENELKKGQLEYDNLNDKYKELTNLKKQLDLDNESLNSKLREQNIELIGIRRELESMRQSMKIKESEWRSERSALENRIRESELPNKALITDLNNDISNLKKENNTLVTRLEDLRKANDDLSDKLKDYEAVSKIHQALTPDTTALESEIRKLKNALENMEKAKKADLAQCKMRYEHRITAINDEIQAIQNQLSRYKRERDTYKHMLEGAQKTIAELKSARGRQSNASSGKSDEEEEVSGASKLVLETQINSLEDELSEARLEASRLKAELVSEKSASHVKVSELQSRINELEEEKVLTSGRTKIPGLKVRMELAWQKEREEHQRLLQETATLARDLRQTLFEIERERSKERLENKRRQDQLKKVYDEEKEESKKKLLELQCDLLELRDAHAKLRTSNEKMRREKERHEKEREELKDVILKKCKQEQIELRNLNVLMQQVNDLMKLFPELNGIAENGTANTYTPTPPRRLKGPKSRESSPLSDSRSDIRGSNSQFIERTEKLEYTVKKLMDVAKELKESKKSADEVNTTRLKKLGKRSTSVESDPGKGITTSRSKPRLKRKSLSLEQTSVRNEESRIWGTDSNMSSLQSLESSDAEGRAQSLQRDSSVDSRLSTGSTKSEMLEREKKHSKGIIKKITTKLTKSASVDDPNISMDLSLQTSGSETSINEKTEKKNLKKKLTDMFKRGSRSSSVEKKISSTNHSRPASRNSTTSNK
ncbi:myosin-10-like isoform X4 [Bombus vosnesenskii]|uniref:Myosin-10-like isoform X4 n=2 Tax=Pyrobombus TaxID=144703 RepID=A0A6J3KNP1_9HYME|nr:myosin-10-like isoform X4 [Bombus vosnesenskii]XP_050481045.1 myosin-10-like isoform X1 [Bombus huntii]XP_050481055.1 myosin-10-like isoform X1 [Bombus huntii]XP_050481064.1 myosin-10-like isoform X1 [Bombus huntii]